jgi:photosystem II stability/assembly factor-like uncharacterized protein
MSIYITPNPNQTGARSGDLYVLDTSGGFSLDQTFPQINMNALSPITQYDVTDAIQVHFSVRSLNDKIGVFKDASNNKVVQLLYDLSADSLLVDDLTLDTVDFLQNVNSTTILSLGKLTTLYSDFDATVKSYFGDPLGFSTFFANENFAVNNGIFNNNTFLEIINGFSFSVAGSYVTDLSGAIKITDLNKHLRYITAANPFNNRPTADNYDITEGFLDGDLIFVPNGMVITLTVNIQPEGYVNINNMGPSNLSLIDSSLNYFNNTTGVGKSTTYSLTNITQTYNVPVLLILSNKDYYTLGNYGQTWTNVLATNVNWLAIGMSSTGQYQTLITDTGDIYISRNYGQTWTVSYNIGSGASNSIAVSDTGQYQTASNGEKIFISSNHGRNWLQTYSMGSSTIYVSISLNGQYQNVVSCGDTVYQSNNYGITWTGYQDQGSALYNSIETFPTAGCAMTYTGQTQVIATESIYISNDFGRTWTSPFTDEFNDKNWDSVDISSDGRYYTALDSGGDIYRSDDHGVTWNYVNDPLLLDKQWSAIAMGASGQFQTALEQGGAIHVSTDYGVSWANATDPNLQNRNWQCVAISANGVYQTIAEYGGGVYTSRLT